MSRVVLTMFSLVQWRRMFQGQLDFFFFFISQTIRFLIRTTTAGFNGNPTTCNVVPFLPVSPKLRTTKFALVYDDVRRCRPDADATRPRRAIYANTLIFIVLNLGLNWKKRYNIVGDWIRIEASLSRYE